MFAMYFALNGMNELIQLKVKQVHEDCIRCSGESRRTLDSLTQFRRFVPSFAEMLPMNDYDLPGNLPGVATPVQRS